MKEYLDEQVARINVPQFIEFDPVQFVHRYTRLQDVEIVAFTVATIAWGKRESILKDATRMLQKMGCSPYDYVMEGGYRQLGTANVHRTFFEHHLATMLRGFHEILSHHDSMEAYLRSCFEERAAEVDAWDIAPKLYLPYNVDKSALKRINMALRWLVRTDGIVDLGVWSFIRPSQLYIPLDVHVANTARGLGLLQRKSNDRKAVEELTATLRTFCPDDPVKYDFALFGLGVEK
ncbi:MAG: TIGR02757 family protein [Mediterranea sp.]|nr:TIGR02757 family protein [Mediterranea sp.]